MKELESWLQDEVKLKEEIPIKKALTKIAELRPQPGQRIFELNLTTGLINEAKFKEEKAVLIQEFNMLTNKQSGIATKIVMDIFTNPGCLYVNAINPQNADKKFHRMLHKPYKKRK